jgi:hypothetical protein
MSSLSGELADIKTGWSVFAFQRICEGAAGRCNQVPGGGCRWIIRSRGVRLERTSNWPTYRRERNSPSLRKALVRGLYSEPYCKVRSILFKLEGGEEIEEAQLPPSSRNNNPTILKRSSKQIEKGNAA